MEYAFMFLILFAMVFVISIVYMSIYAVKNSKKHESQIEVNKLELPNTKANDAHIKDFFDINAGKESRFADLEDVDEEVNTLGADFKSFIAQSKECNKLEKKKTDIINNFSDFENDFKTVSLDDDFSFDFEDDNNDTINMTDDLESLANKNRINVVLKYKYADINKVVKMITPQVTVGRGIGNDLLFGKDTFASRNHGVFILRDNNLYIKDLNSKNGTYINKTQRVIGEVIIEESCEVTFGNAVVDVSITK
ncbi:MAG: FHA domain-containing protein [Lachnospirales bacterium]